VRSFSFKFHINPLMMMMMMMMMIIIIIIMSFYLYSLNLKWAHVKTVLSCLHNSIKFCYNKILLE